MAHASPKAELLIAAAARKNRIVKDLTTMGIKVFERKKHISFLADLPDTINAFVPKDKRNDPAYMKKLIKDITENHYIYMISPAEYFLLDFANLTDSQKHEFVGEHEKNLLCRATRGNDWRILWDKNSCYQAFQQYFKRDAVAVTSESDRDALFAFIKAHGSAIIKEARGTLGKGIQIVHDDSSEMNEYWASIRDSLSKKATYIAEELIVQCDELARFHPTSVNTVRIMTFRKDGEVTFLGSFFRMGSGNSIVDNAGSGGIFAEVDIQSGRIVGSGISKTGKRFNFHPDTGVQIKDYQMPKWPDLLDLCKKMATVLNDQPYTGWDCALTDNGWVMVEGNSQAQFVNQYPNRHGMRELVEKTFYALIDSKKGR